MEVIDLYLKNWFLDLYYQIQQIDLSSNHFLKNVLILESTSLAEFLLLGWSMNFSFYRSWIDTFRFCFTWRLTNVVKNLLGDHSASQSRCWEISNGVL